MFKMSLDHQVGIELRKQVVQTLQALMAEDEKVVALEADLGGASGWTALAQQYEHRLLNVGIAEANMVGVAAGLNLAGFAPFMHTFAPFATRRAFDQLYISGGYAKTTINIFGSDPGFAVGGNGGTHTSFEDIALMRSIPNALVCDAADAVQMDWIIREFAKLSGIHYVRGNRKGVHNIYEAGSTFTFGKGNLLKSGKDVLLIATGQLVYDTLVAAKELAQAGIDCTVIDMFTIKPLDKELLVQHLSQKKLVMTVENHSITGGLGSGVAEVLAEKGVGIPLVRIGVNEQFGQVGTPEFLQKAYHLTAADIAKAVRERI